MSASRSIVLDVETAPMEGAADYLEPAQAPSNYKDPAKIKEFCDAQDASNLRKLSLDPDLCRIVAIGVRDECMTAPRAVCATDEAQESEILASAWRLIDEQLIIGYNVVGFDLPVLLRRSLYLGVKAPHLELSKYRHPRVRDLMMDLSFNGELKYRPLKFYAKRFGLPQTGDTLDGKDIQGCVERNEWDRITSHVIADVSTTVALAERLGYFKAQV
jgi:hypothetical protein